MQGDSRNPVYAHIWETRPGPLQYGVRRETLIGVERLGKASRILAHEEGMRKKEQ